MAKQPRYPATVGPFTFAYPHLTSPDSEGQYADNKYKVDGVTEPTSAAAKSTKTVLAAAMKALGTPKEANLPFKKQREKVDGKQVETGKLLFRTKSQYAPAIVDASGKPIPTAKLAKMKIGAGSEGLLQGYFQNYELTVTERIDGEKVTTKEPGLSFTLTGVQIIKLVSGGSNEASFGAYEGGGFTLDDDDGEGLDDSVAGDDDSDVSDDGGLDI